MDHHVTGNFQASSWSNTCLLACVCNSSWSALIIQIPSKFTKKKKALWFFFGWQKGLSKLRFSTRCSTNAHYTQQDWKSWSVSSPRRVRYSFLVPQRECWKSIDCVWWEHADKDELIFPFFFIFIFFVYMCVSHNTFSTRPRNAIWFSSLTTRRTWSQAGKYVPKRVEKPLLSVYFWISRRSCNLPSHEKHKYGKYGKSTLRLDPLGCHGNLHTPDWHSHSKRGKLMTIHM